MILYCDTSALVKLYVREQGSDQFRDAWKRSPRRASAEIAYAEAMAAFARRWRCGDISDDQYATVAERFCRDFASMIRVPQSVEINERIADLVRQHPLRGFDAIHLASAGLLRDAVETPVRFACYDAALNRAAGTDGLELLAS